MKRSILKKFFAFLSVAASAFLLFSCSVFESDTRGGVISLALPDSSSARSISTSGNAPSNDFIEAYEVRVRNAENKMVQKISGATPGSTISIDKLSPDTYTISVLAYYSAVDWGETYDYVTYYGKISTKLSAGENKTVSLALRDFENSGTYITVYINPINSALDEWSELGSNNNYSCTITGNGVNFTFEDMETVGNGNDYGCMPPGSWYCLKDKFLEPGFAYTFDVTVIKAGWVEDNWVDVIRKYHGSKTQVVEESNYQNQGEHAVSVEVE
ncbi:hypothetical protein [Treponema sp.]|uniref:hypothetical protein n=1 Tax=Treponema sp. TaxID=166 RepID=UPI0038908566